MTKSADGRNGNPPILPIVFVAVATLLATWLGRAEPAGLDEDEGAELFGTHCAGCHGPAGAGDGKAAPFVYPRPRDFTAEKFKFGGSTREIERTLRRGIPGSSMPSFRKILGAREIRAVAAHVRTLAGENAVPLPVDAPAPPKPVGSVERGQVLYERDCVRCHGETGKGDGPAVKELETESGVPIRPPSFASGAFRGGSEPREIAQRILAGIPGTPMPEFRDAITGEEVWDLVAYVLSLASSAPAEDSGPLHVRRVPRSPHEPTATAWERAEPSTLPLHPLWRRPSWPPAVEVRGVHDGERLALRFEWEDTTSDVAVSRQHDASDALAVMLPTEPADMPFVGMGDADTVVHIWHWRATGEEQGPAFARPELLRDANPWEDRPFAEPASAVGNPLVSWRRKGGTARAPHLFELVASGPGTLTAVPRERVFARGEGTWREGRWRLVVSRPLEPDRGDVALPPGTTTLVAFAVWDGSAGDRDGQKSITSWIPLEVER